MTLWTPRLAFVQTPTEAIRNRIASPDVFGAETLIGEEWINVEFPTEWPGDLAAHLPMMLRTREAGGPEPFEGTVIERGPRIAVGQMGCMGFPDEEGRVEIGYGMNPSAQNRGIATEIVSIFARWLLAQPEVAEVQAQCQQSNLGSVRVLQKCGFVQQGTRNDSSEGPLLQWRLSR